MSNVFKKIINLDVKPAHSFDMNSEVYETLIGDGNMPMSDDGAMALAVMVDYGVMAKLLLEASIISEEYIEDMEPSKLQLMHIQHSMDLDISEAAIRELDYDPEMARSLLGDFTDATLAGENWIYYWVG